MQKNDDCLTRGFTFPATIPPQTNDVMLLLGHCGFRQHSAGCLATGYRTKIIKLL